MKIEKSVTARLLVELPPFRSELPEAGIQDLYTALQSAGLLSEPELHESALGRSRTRWMLPSAVSSTS